MSALSTRRRFLGFSFPVHWKKAGRRSRRTRTSVPADATPTHNGGRIGERTHSVIHHLAAHRFTLISVFVVPLFISVSRLSHALAAPFFVFLLHWRRCGTCGNAVGLGCVVLAYGRECLVLRRSSSVLVCRVRVGFVWWRTVQRRRHFFSGWPSWCCAGSQRRTITGEWTNWRIAGDRSEFSGSLGGSQPPS